MTARVLAMATAAALLASPLPAQEEMHGEEMEGHPPMMQEHPRPMMHGMMGGMMGGRMGPAMMQKVGPGPMMLLRMKDALDLTGEQVARLEEMRDEVHASMRTHMDAATAAREAALEALAGDEPDLEAYEAKLREVADQRLQAHLAMVRAHRATRDLLEPTQREKLETGFEMMRGMRGMMRMHRGTGGMMGPREGGMHRGHRRMMPHRGMRKDTSGVSRR